MSKLSNQIAVCSRSFSKNEVLRNELLSKFSNVHFNDEGLSLVGEDLVKFLKEQEGAIIGLELMNEKVLSFLPKLKIISKYGVGLDKVDFDALKKRDITFSFTEGVNKRSVSELTLTFILNLLRKINIHNSNLEKGIWKNEGGSQITGKTVGIIGFGHIGKDLRSLLKPFGCKIIFNDLLDMNLYEDENCKQASKEEVLSSSDVVTIHVPYNSKNHHLLGKEDFNLMKKGAILINSARGGLVNEKHLFSALCDGRLGGAAMDTFEVEPSISNPLFTLPNFIGTPHVGGGTDEAVLAMGRAAISNIEAYFK